MKKLEARKVSVIDMAEARERRVAIQNKYLEHYSGSLLSFSLNIPGPYKVSDSYLWAFEQGKNWISETLCQTGFQILAEESIYEVTGYQYFLSVEGNPFEIKKSLIAVEEDTPMGRIFDIDILKSDGSKVSREEIGLPVRKCILCDKDVYLCSRNRSHSVDELVTKINEMIDIQKKKQV